MTTDVVYEPGRLRIVPLVVLRRLLHLFRFRGRFRLGNICARLLLPKQRCVLPNAQGGRMVFDIGNIHEVSMFYDLFAEELTDVLHRTLRPGDTFIDCGANVGYFTFLAASLTGTNGKVISIDANPYCTGRIAESRSQDENPHVEIIQAAISGEPGELTFNIANDPMYSSVSDLNQTSFAKIKQQITVPVVVMDELTRQRQLTQRGAVRLAKIDVEGAEIDMLNGSRAVLKDEVIDFIYVELHDQQLKAKGQHRDEVQSILIEFGYTKVFQPSSAWVVYQSESCLQKEGSPW